MYRYLKIYTPSYKNLNYIKIKNLYQDNIKEAHNRLLKLKTVLFNNKSTLNNKTVLNSKNNKFKVELIGLDGTVKYSFNKVDNNIFDIIFKKIDKMPLARLKNKTKKLSLYSDYNPKTTLKGTGFKNALSAKKTLKLIANRNLTYQKQVVNTMYNRAKYHPYQTKDMKDAMSVYAKWINKHK